MAHAPLQVISVGSAGGVVSVNADTGALLWSQATDGAIQGAPVAIQNSVFIGSNSVPGEVVSYDVNYQGSSGDALPPYLKAAKSVDKFVVGELLFL